MYNSIFKPSSELTFNTASTDLSAFKAFLSQSDDESVCVDLAAVTHCDSAGLAVLIEAKRLCLSHGKQLVVHNMPNEVSALAKFCGVDLLWG